MKGKKIPKDKILILPLKNDGLLNPSTDLTTPPLTSIIDKN